MEQTKKRSKWWTVALLSLLLIGGIVLGVYLKTEQFRHRVSELHGSIFGNEYIIDTFDNNGIKTLTTHGKKIDITANAVKEKVNMEDANGQLETLSSVITITIDGKQLISCGDTCVFYDKSLTPDYEFFLESIESSGGGLDANTLIAGRVNSIKNQIGKPMVVIIKSQTGAPIYVFSGKSVYWEVAEDLPKFTKLSIDGKPLYIHRANFQIIDLELLG